MVFVKDSLSVILLGDWNKLFIQPNWVAENIFERDEMEIGVNGQGSDFGISYRCNNVRILPEQSKIVFAITNMNKENLEYMANCNDEE